MKLQFKKYADGLVPAIVQDARTGVVLMLGFMDEAALQKTMDEKRVTFFSRSKQRLWTKGETSGHFLDVVEILPDCDEDTVLIKAIPSGPVCHTGSDTCFSEKNAEKSFTFLPELEQVINERFENPSEGSYINSLIKKGIKKMAQKVGEEGVEVALEAQGDEAGLFLGEAADLVFHLMVLLRAKGFSMGEVEAVLRERHLKR
ncbi:MAG: bifunctional phosphoribosyl-AMP cyclohydrolase/phosphoribosyl-ATP diphosphatase HisIE [Lewinellaceae bacterium]|nr:bifunctional phosphoribosyl-AMP cyclohydrolase/phosphoribosyl-ATP diphosphatase HisIE [Saprospiraceae bacterium]MCB9339316.1 bifunctional phosphoribosyl-AMP cyclohydrolase/phosphoribosyl-ATP diphosphatase HisIE [Lewinellaceae bacterium]